MCRSDGDPVTLLAHSADLKRNVPAQPYAAHVGGVRCRADRAADEAAKFAARDGSVLRAITRDAAVYHDLGKLDQENQRELAKPRRSGRALPIQHTDAGTAYLFSKLAAPLAAVLARSHHIGLPDFPSEENRPTSEVFRDENPATRSRIDATLDQLIALHKQAVTDERIVPSTYGIQGDPALFFRLALSCLVDGDHTDTAVNYGDYDETKEEPVSLRPAERLAALDRYAASLGDDKKERSRARTKFYALCRDSLCDAPIASCDSPVGTGKTTAVMAYLLAQAEKQGLRRVFVVLPFTNIIRQSVKTYRNALVLPGENPEYVVAELHHRADFESEHSRQFTALWKAPIVVTTAVTFFETLASSSPATLRRLHCLPGSAIFVDESHAALPAKLLPLAWQWIKTYAAEWGCRWVLASGSLNRFWEIEEFDPKKPRIPEIAPNDFRNLLTGKEERRVTHEFRETPMSASELVLWINSLPAPRLVVLNTIQSAAVVANEYAKTFGREKVEHISTALTPTDRDKTLEKIEKRLQQKKDDDWTLIATSCVEAGVDFSFKTGIREAAALVALLQLAGRINRHEEYVDAMVWTILLKNEGLLKSHPAMENSARILLELFRKKTKISPSLCTQALQREIRLEGNFSAALMGQEESLKFPDVEKNFRVISGDTRPVVVDPTLIERISNNDKTLNWRDIQRGSVQLWEYRLRELAVEEFADRPGLYQWKLPYDNFLGYMKGVLSVETFVKNSDDAYMV